MKKYFYSTRWLFLVAILIVALDQISKVLIRQNLAFGEIWSPWEWLTPYARFIHISNTGAAFGIFKNGNPIFMVLAVIVSGAILYYYPRIPDTEKVIRFSLSLQLAGAVGNLIDRIFLGHVTDFISVGNFAIFNIADSSITVGVAILLIAVWMQDRKEKKASLEKENQEPAEEA